MIHNKLTEIDNHNMKRNTRKFYKIWNNLIKNTGHISTTAKPEMGIY